VILWHVTLTVVAVRVVFGDPRMDVRFLALGAVLPDLLDLPWGRPAAFHSLVGCVGLLVAIMLGTIGHRRLRRQLLPLAIGALVHLVLDGMWVEQDVLLWPFSDDVPHLSLWPSGWSLVVQEGVGLLVAVRLWQRCGLSDPERRRALWREGRLEPVTPEGGVAT
jgi:hypothetical protein